MSETPPKPGQTIYSRSGEVFEFGEVIDERRWIVYATYEGGGWEGEPEQYRSEHPRIAHASDFSLTPPKAILEAEITKMAATLKELQEKVRVAREESFSLDRERANRMDRIKDHNNLQYIDEYLAGKITHFLFLDNLGIKAVKDLSRRNEGVGLMVLQPSPSVASPSGTIWKLAPPTRARTGDAILPFMSLEDAVEELTQHVHVYFDGYVAGQSSIYQLDTIMQVCKTHNIAIPQVVIDKQHEHALRAAEGLMNSARASLENATKKYIELRRKK